MSWRDVFDNEAFDRLVKQIASHLIFETTFYAKGQECTMRTLLDLIASNNTIRYALNPAFYRVFGFSIAHYWDNFSGFDIVEFERRLFGDGEYEGTMHDAVLERFGEEGVILVQKAIGTMALSSDDLKEAQRYLPKHHTDRYYPTLESE